MMVKTAVNTATSNIPDSTTDALEIDARAIAPFHPLALGNAFTSMALLLKNARVFGKFPHFPESISSAG